MDKQAIGITLYPSNVGLTLYARIYNSVGIKVGDDITSTFFEVGNGNYTLVCDQIPDDFHGTIAFYNSSNDELLASTELNPIFQIVSLPFTAITDDKTRQTDILMFAGDTTNITWYRKSHYDPSQIVFVIKQDNEDLLEDALLVVSYTDGCEVVLGVPSNDASLATLWIDKNFVYLTMKSELTMLYSSVLGSMQYDLKYTSEEQGTKTIGMGLVNVVLGGSV